MTSSSSNICAAAGSSRLRSIRRSPRTSESWRNFGKAAGVPYVRLGEAARRLLAPTYNRLVHWTDRLPHAQSPVHPYFLPDDLSGATPNPVPGSSMSTGGPRRGRWKICGASASTARSGSISGTAAAISAPISTKASTADSWRRSPRNCAPLPGDLRRPSAAAICGGSSTTAGSPA